MKVIYTATARRHIASQIGYLIDQGAPRPAARLRRRIADFITNFVARYPRAAPYIRELDIHECWIPRTPYMLQYRIDAEADTVIILALFHSAQDRRR